MRCSCTFGNAFAKKSKGRSGRFGEKLIHIPKSLEFQGITRWIQEKHGGLFPDFAFKPDVGLDNKGDALGPKRFGEPLKGIPGEHHAVMRNGNILPVYGVGVQGLFGLRFVVNDDLMTKDVKIDPMITASAFFASQDIPVKTTTGFQVVNGNGDVKRGNGFHIPKIKR